MSLSLLRLLADGQCHSGQSLGQSLGVSRAAVWKQIEVMSHEGVTIESHRGKGYRWLQASPLLSARLITENLAYAGAYPILPEVLENTDSTNKQLLERAQQAALMGTTLIAEQQSAGRGRRGRVWQSPLAQNLYVSTLFRVSGGANVLQGLSLVVGISLAETLNAKYGMACQLKWPNDLLLNDRKLGGILVELQGDISGECAAVVGFGLNVNMSSANDIDQPWTSVAAKLGHTVCRNKMVADCLSALYEDFNIFAKQGFEVFMSRWQRLDAYRDRSVTITAGNRQDEGVVVGVDASGALLVSSNGEVKSFHGGEVSVRSQ